MLSPQTEEPIVTEEFIVEELEPTDLEDAVDNIEFNHICSPLEKDVERKNCRIELKL